jgi:hypothetical protein
MQFVTPQDTVKASADWFTGDVWFDVIHAGQEPSRMRANLVRFSPGAWHSHVLGAGPDPARGLRYRPDRHP